MENISVDPIEEEIIENAEENSLYEGGPIVILGFSVVGQSPLSDISC
jgi:hypothetical protein